MRWPRDRAVPPWVQSRLDTDSVLRVLTIAPRWLTGLPAQDKERLPSFVIDYDQPAVQKLLPKLHSMVGPSSEAQVLQAFVKEHVRGTLQRGWDVASVVAQRREGDCSEYATLAAALARARGRAARVINGIAFVAEHGRVQAFGHVWAEVETGSGWALVDAALPLEEVLYVPVAVLRDESAAYQMTVMADLQRTSLARVNLLGN